LSVLVTLTGFTYCCSFNRKRKTNGNFVPSIIASALDGCVLLDSGPGRCMPGEDCHYILSSRLCGPQIQSEHFGGHRKHSPLPEFEPRNRPAQSLPVLGVMFLFLYVRISLRNQ